MKKMFNKMSNTVKTMTCKAHCAMTCARAHLSAPLCNTRGEGYIDTAISPTLYQQEQRVMQQMARLPDWTRPALTPAEEQVQGAAQL